MTSTPTVSSTSRADHVLFAGSLPDRHALASVWLPRRGGVEKRHYARVAHPTHESWISVSSGGGPFWVEVDEATFRLAVVLDAEAFDPDAQGVTASCMVGGWGDQATMRAAMDHGSRRWTALVNAATALRYLDGSLGRLATAKQVAYVEGLLASRHVEGDLYRETYRILDRGLVTRTEAADLIPRLKACPQARRQDYEDYEDYDGIGDGEQW